MRPQFAKRTHRARDALELAGRDLPGIWQDYERARLAKPPPRHVYITDEAGELAHAAAMWRNHSPPGALPADAYTTLAAWRMTQGIYQPEPGFSPLLVRHPWRLPQWCVYVETPGHTVMDSTGTDSDLPGTWARLDQSGALVLLLDLPTPETRTLRPKDDPGDLAPVAALVLALGGCQITGKRGPPTNPEPVRTRQGWRLFPALGPSFWAAFERF